MIDKVVADIRRALRDAADEKTLAAGKRFFKEDVKMYGVKMPEAGKIGKLALAQVKTWSKEDVFELCNRLWQSGYVEEAAVACVFSDAMDKRYTPDDFATFERWVANHVTNWAACDSLCNHTVGTFVEMYPRFVAELKRWALSENRWMRRAAAVTLIIPARKGLFLSDVLEIADTLLLDGDDLVQKGYGWMLKAASMSEPTAAARAADPEIRRQHLDAVFDFVMARRATMPRTALRYAIEKMPSEMRAAAMAKIDRTV